VMRSLPTEAPVLSCHDQLYALEHDIPLIQAKTEEKISQLAQPSE
jgi:hypothetical protein